MSRVNRRLLLLIAAELAVGAVISGRRLTRPDPPEPDWTLIDPVTATEFRTAAAGCESAEDWRKLGELYMADGCFRESERCHRIACKLNPNDATLARQWAFALERLAMLDEANVQYRRAAELQPEQADAIAYFIGRNLLRADKPQEARAAFAEGKALDANCYELARLHLRAGELTEAEVLLQRLTITHPNTLQVHLFGYRVAMERGDARQAFIRADDARYATDKLQTPFDEEAFRIVKVTQSLGPRRQWKEGRDLIEKGRLDEAENVLLDANRRFPNPGIDELFADLALRRGRFEEAVTLLEGIEARNGRSARIAAQIGNVWDAAGQPAKARTSWLWAAQLEAGANLKDVHHNLARSFVTAGDKVAAERHLARGHYFVGRDLLRFGYAQQSINYFAAAGKHDPSMESAWFYLGEARRRAGLTEPAAIAYRSCLQLNPDHGRALAGLAAVDGVMKK